MSFHEVLFPEDISYGSSGGPGFNTTVLELSSGKEQRNINWSEARATYEVSHGVKTKEQMDELLDFFHARRGKAYGFRFKDWSDYELVNQVVAIGDGSETTFQLIKRYEPATAHFYDRPLRKIVPNSCEGVIVGGVLLGVNDWTIDNNTGLLTLDSAPALDAEVIVTFLEFHVPVRFDTDKMDITHDAYQSKSWPSIPLVELKQ